MNGKGAGGNLAGGGNLLNSLLLAAETTETGMQNGSLVRPAREEDLPQIRKIFNFYVRESFAAYPVHEVDAAFFEALYREGDSSCLCVVECGDAIAGFGMIRPYLPFPSFQGTAQVSCFLHPSWTRRGLGGTLLDHLTRLAQSRGIQVLLANISSRNEASIQFHNKHGFRESGRLRGVGEKFGEKFDVVWMQKEV